jgi:hypothetical protein
MKKQRILKQRFLEGRWRLRFVGQVLLALWLAFPFMAWPQKGKGVAPDVKVLAALRAHAYDWSPAGRQVAYAAEGGIWIVQAPDFQQPKRLIRSVALITQIAWSPDGQKLAFAGSRPGDGWMTIWVAEADGSSVRDLLPPRAPFISPGVRAVGISTWLNNREIAFEEHCGTGCVALNKVDVDSRAYWGLSTDNLDEGYEWAPTKEWVIAGKHQSGLGLVDASRIERVRKNVSSYSAPEARYRAVVEGCVVKERSGMGMEYHFDSWSPDGKHVLYTGWVCLQQPATESKVSLYLWQPTGGRRERILPNAGWAAWSPDGSQIAFLLLGKPRYDQSQRIIGTDFVVGRPFRAYVAVMDVATRAVRALIPLESGLTSPKSVWFWNPRADNIHPIWSPDSQHLLIRNAQGDWFLVRAEGSDRQRITQGIQAQPSWSPDGKRLAIWLFGESGYSQKEEAEFSARSTFNANPSVGRADGSSTSKADRPFFTPGNLKKRSEAKGPPVAQSHPSLYIIEVPSGVKQP